MYNLSLIIYTSQQFKDILIWEFKNVSCFVYIEKRKIILFKLKELNYYIDHMQQIKEKHTWALEGNIIG